VLDNNIIFMGMYVGSSWVWSQDPLITRKQSCYFSLLLP
jgi:hypothetical protein